MTPESWARIKEIFSSAMEMPAAEREAFLQDACPEAELRSEVERLLEAEDLPSLESPLENLWRPVPPPVALGHYRIIRLLGEGGMGAVYEAEQDHPRRRVAIKAVKTGLASPALLRRFEHESQALGRLHHPGIAQIYEAGTADSGFGPQPYFAMEFIQGISLLRYAKEHRPSVRERLEMMVKVCEAVQHAHQKGIIHRDLKPANILVDETGQPKIVDFGVARATDADAQATTQTGFGQILGTLAYMSPEQVLGDPLELDTRSDVYALGVILYELLAGRLPYQVSGQLTKAVQTIREEDPARLSSVNRTYRGDIENIVAKALEKEKARRYSSSAELASDIQRYLRDEPIVARRSTAVYHLRKFARRHRGLVIGVSAVFVALVAGVIVSTWEAARAWRAGQEALRQRDSAAGARLAAQKERDRAVSAEQTAMDERNRALAEKQHADTQTAAAQAISEFLQKDMLAQAASSVQARSGTRPDPDLKVRTALDRAAARIAGRFDRQPLVEAAIRQTIGDTYLGLGIYAEAQRQLARALDLRRRTLGERNRDTLETMFLLAVVYRNEGKYGEAEPLFHRVVDARRQMLGESNNETLSALGGLAMLYYTQSRFPEAEAIFSRVLETRRRTLGPEHRDTLAAMDDLATAMAMESKYPAAEALFKQEVDLDKRVKGEEHPDTLVASGNLASIYTREGKFALSEPILLPLLETQRRVVGEDHPDTLSTMDSLLTLYRLEGKYSLAETLAHKLLEARQRTLGPEHPDTLTAMNSLAMIYTRQYRYADTESLLTQALEVSQRLYGEQNRNTVIIRYNLAAAYADEGKYPQGEELLAKNIDTLRRLYGEDHPDTLTNVIRLAVVYRQEGRYAEAEPMHVKVYEGRLRVMGPEHRDTVTALVALAILYQDEGKPAEAEPLLSKAIVTARRIFGASNSTTKAAMGSLAKLRITQRRYADAESILRDSLSTKDDEGPYSWQPFERRSLLGLSLLEQSKFAEAEPALIAGYRGLIDRRAALPPVVSLRQVGDRIVRLYTSWGKPDQAAAWRKELEATQSVAKE